MAKNNILSELIVEASILGNKSPFWKRIAKELKKPARSQRKVNLTKIEKFAKDNLTVVVPGKVLGIGTLTKKVDIVAYGFSDSAKAKIKKAGGKATDFKTLMKKNPSGKGVMILG